MNCIDCIHYGICTFHLTNEEYKRCVHFKPKSRYIELPCAVGDTVYRIVEMGTGIRFKYVGRYEVAITKSHKIAPCEETIKRFIRSVVVTKNNFFDVCEKWGKNVFLTKEEAEKVLEERGNK